MNKPYNSKSLRVVFPCGTDKYGEQAESSSELTVIWPKSHLINRTNTS